MVEVDKSVMINSFVEYTLKINKLYKKIFFPSDRHCCPRWPHSSPPTNRWDDYWTRYFCNWTYSSHTNHIQFHYAIIVTVSHPPTHCASSSPFPHPPHSLSLIGKIITYQKHKENLMRELLEVHHTPLRSSTGGRPATDNPLRLTAQHFPCKVPLTAAQGSCTGRHCKVCLSGTRRSKQRK